MNFTERLEKTTVATLTVGLEFQAKMSTDDRASFEELYMAYIKAIPSLNTNPKEVFKQARINQMANPVLSFCGFIQQSQAKLTMFDSFELELKGEFDNYEADGVKITEAIRKRVIARVLKTFEGKKGFNKLVKYVANRGKETEVKATWKWEMLDISNDGNLYSYATLYGQPSEWQMSLIRKATDYWIAVADER